MWRAVRQIGGRASGHAPTGVPIERSPLCMAESVPTTMRDRIFDQFGHIHAWHRTNKCAIFLIMHAQERSPRRGTRELRLGRHSLPGNVYHISTATMGRAPLLGNFQCGRAVVVALAREQVRNGAHTLAFVVMPDHFHWLLQLPDHADLSQCVSNVKSSSAKEINRQRDTSGPIWQRGFFDRGIRSDEELIGVARYIVASPLRAGIVGEIGQYSLWDAIWVRHGFQL